MKPRSAQTLMQENTLVKHYAGSIAYGTNLPTSDVDFRGIFCGDQINVRTPFFPVRECEDSLEEDTKLYELAHFMKLCLDCNPNIIETLWVDDGDIVATSDAYKHLRDNRHKLLSSKIAFTTSGYALSQLKRIKGHNKWINNPQSLLAPKQTDHVSLVQHFGSEKMLKLDIEKYRDDHRLIPYGRDVYGVYPVKGYQLYSNTHSLNTLFEEDRHEYDSPLMIVKFNKEEYNLSKEKWKQYWTWKDNRNEKRSELEEQHGYDTKHAMHLVRLLRMGFEVLRDEEIIVKRPDAKELLEIRGGSLSYEEVVKYAEDMDKQVREVWYKKTNLPKKPNVKYAAQLLMEVQDMVWSND
jgi:predicted nucleotidyltransferase